MSTKRATNGYREWRVDRRPNGLLVLTVRGIHQGELFIETSLGFQFDELKEVHQEMRRNDVRKRDVLDEEVG